jgi:hypothetical protein
MGTVTYTCAAGHRHGTVTDVSICNEQTWDTKISSRATTRSLDKVSTVVEERGRYQLRVLPRDQRAWLVWDTVTEHVMTRTDDRAVAVDTFDQLVAYSAKHDAL